MYGLSHRLLFFLKVSRPGLWFPTLWLYLLPTAGTGVLYSSPFWMGLLYASFPLNFLVYGWNDIVDEEIDRYNPRKDTFLFGAKGNHDELTSLPTIIAAVQCVIWPVLVYLSSWTVLLVMLGILFFCWIYNARGWGLRSVPPFELLCQVGYLLVVPLSCILNEQPIPDWRVWVYLILFCMQSQLIGEVMDIVPDRKGGRRTTGTELGKNHTKLLIIGIVMAESVLVWFWFSDLYFAVGLLGFVGWLCLDRFVLYKNREYSMMEFYLFGYGSNAIALASMVYVWNTKIFLS